ncbi:MAG: efflux RND transporter periplasmic adaptor subunit [Ancalomicrobiaceae bacterium]|nr:efflux RND transporter periplasmic adaptor subunit [Ancalomicrobiaceae bacterium]
MDPRRTPLLAALIATTALLAAAGSAAAADVTVTPRMVDDLKAVIATVEPLHQLLARARIGGTVVKLMIKEGDRVAAGATVALIVDPKIALQMAALDARIQSAGAQLDQARLDLNRASELQKSGTTSQSTLDQRKTALEVAEKAFAALKADRDVVAQQATEGSVLAPAAGRVLTLATTEGSVVLTGETIATLAEDRYILRLALPERHAASLRAGDPVSIASRDAPADSSVTEAAKQGRVRIVYPEIQGGRVIADVDVDGLGSYFIGERTRVYVPTGKRQALIVPANAVYVRAGIHYVQLKGGAEVVVQPGEARAEGLEILSGLTVGDIVVTP